MARFAAYFVGSMTAAALWTPSFAATATSPRSSPSNPPATSTPAATATKASPKLTRKTVWQVPPSTPVALVNGEPITVSQWSERLALMAGQQALDSLLAETVLRQEARRQGIRISPTELNTRVDQEMKSFKERIGTEAQYQDFLKQRKMSESTIRDALRAQQEIRLLQEKIRDKVTASIQVSDNDIAAAYESQKTFFQIPEEARISHILIPVTGADPQMDAAAKAKAAGILARAKSMTPEQFAELAKETSEDPDTKAKGGEMPALRKPTFFGPAFDAAVFAGMPGLLPDPVRSFRGYHVVYLHAKTPARVRPLDEVKAQLQEQLLNQRRAEFFQKYAADLQKNAKQDIRLQN